ncbi:hypothetical protein GCM10027445_46750 [Amycolatopsis endophytica]|uniref:Xylan 1,4-beta-xylosidase n=1 Tax=Amycolatopsis endophytica TaxID=860233 RepID=A0A853BCX9_9PSEU|nr:hypothetical protein [Amycolatopsis endophytica]NYI92507.1 hypothetical protein [Amycolatopsis endophytica]
MLARVGIFAVVALLVAGLFGWAPGERDDPPAPPAVTLLPGTDNGLVLGVTHAQYSLDSWLTPGQRESGEQILGATPMLQNQHIMGFGVGNPEEVPGRYDWSRLDERMDLIGRTGGTPVITLCCAPDWMKGGAVGTTNWDDLAAAPLRSHFADYARLSAEVAQRYPQVRHFQVWNELKGFWDDETGTWDAAAYTDLYNQVYDAVKEVRPDALIGGPYVVLTSWSSAGATDHPSDLRGPYGVVDQRSLDVVEYWNEHKHGADFVALDASTGTRDKGLITTPDQASRIYADATRWAHTLTGLPVWWSEFYPETAPPASETTQDPDTLEPVENTRGTETTDGAAPDDQARAVATLDAVARAADAGAAAMLLWQPEASDDLPYAALWSEAQKGTDVLHPTSLTAAWTWLAPRLRGGLVDVQRDPSEILQFSTPRGDLTVNPRPVTGQLRTAWRSLSLPPLAIRLPG